MFRNPYRESENGDKGKSTQKLELDMGMMSE